MREDFLPFSPPAIGEEEIAEVGEAMRSGWITTGPQTARFEKEFADLLGVEAALGVASGTDAMQVGLGVLGVGEGDEVITSTMTFCSTAHVIEHVGARPVFVDVEPGTLNMDVGVLEESITERTKAILPVHLYGNPCDMDVLMEVARDNGLFVVEDAAHAFPARHKGRMIGTVGDCTAFSFYATKNITTAEGGMLTGPAELIRRARPWTIHGISKDAHNRYSSHGSWFYEVVLPGFKCNMTDIQAAMGLAQLKKLPDFQRRRRQVAEAYTFAFGTMEELEVPLERPEVESAWHIYALRLRLDRLSIDRGRFIRELAERRIGASVHFIPVHLHPYYRDKYGFDPGDFPVAFREYHRLISLPLHPGLTDADVNDVIVAVGDVVETFRR